MGTTQLLLVHGAWHGPWAWDKVLLGLEKSGYHVETVDLPSHGADTKNLGGLHDDADVVRGMLQSMTGPVVVVGHSYGGMAITEGAAGASNVKRLVYLTAFLMDEGQSLLGALNGQPQPWFQATPDGLAWLPQTPEQVFYNDCLPEDVALLVPKLLPQSTASFTESLRGAAWQEIPSTYIICRQDQAIPVFAQEAMSQGASEIFHLDTGHSPFVSQPDEVVNLLAPYAGD